MAALSTRQLTSAPFELVSDRRARFALRVTLAVVLLAVGAFAALRFHADGTAPAARLMRLQGDNAALRADLERVQAELDIERATRSALDAQVAQLNDELGELRRQLDFVNAQGGRPRRTAAKD